MRNSKARDMTLKEYKQKFNEDDAVGWDAIDGKLKQLYGDQEPKHYGSVIKYMLGGPDPIDGTSIYDSSKGVFHRHLVSYGMSELYYNEEKAGGDFSKWGFEFTFRVKSKEGEDDLKWAISLMNNLARYVFESGNWFEEYHYVPANGPIRLDYPTDLVGLLFVTDPELGNIDTPHGELTFLQLVGVTQPELDLLKSHPEASEQLLEEMRKTNPLLITDLDRKA